MFAAVQDNNRAVPRARWPRRVAWLLAGALLGLQFLLAMHPYTHPLSQREVACQICLLGSHAPPPVQTATVPPLPVYERHDFIRFVDHALDSPRLITAQPRAPPANA